ncbi:MAG: acyltransferase [Coriobacteriales bacterium]|jgi:peptidoglycan/LPS O-acetylase OafA/YrhL|nr:acyltransferase [Coriobacteriales bacterium]
MQREPQQTQSPQPRQVQLGQPRQPQQTQRRTQQPRQTQRRQAQLGQRQAQQTQQPQPLDKYVWLSLLRAFGVILVLTYHFAPSIMPGGFIGVDVFFVFSGYLITSLLVREYVETGKVRLFAFYLRRFRRLLPAVLAMLLVSLPLALLISPDFRVGILKQVSAVLGWVTNYYEIINGQSYSDRLLPHLFVHTWTLAIEMQYYLIWGLVLALLIRIFGKRLWRKASDSHSHTSRSGDIHSHTSRSDDGRSGDIRSHTSRSDDGRSDDIRARDSRVRDSRVRDSRVRDIRSIVSKALILASAGALASFVMMQVLAGGGDDPSEAYYSTVSHIYPLLLGSMAGLYAGFFRTKLVDTLERFRPALALVVTIGALGGIAALAFLLPFANPLVFHFGILATALCTLVALLMGRGMQERLVHHPQPRILTYLADRSYSIYLFHWPLAIVFDQLAKQVFPMGNSLPGTIGHIAFLLIALALTFLLAHLSYRFVEQRFRSGRKPIERSEGHREQHRHGIDSGQHRHGERQHGERWHGEQHRRNPARSRLSPPVLIGSGGAIILLALSGYALASTPSQTLVDQTVASGYLSVDTARLETSYQMIAAEGPGDPVFSNTESSEALEAQKELMRQQVAQGLQAFEGGIVILGDSVSLATAVDCQQQLGPVLIIAEVGKDMYAGMNSIQNQQANGTLDEYLVIALAFNSHANSIDCIDEILTSLEPGHRVVIVTSSDTIGGMNTLTEYLRTLDDAYAFVTIADWAAATRERGDLLAADGYHPATEEAIKLYADLLFDALAQASMKPTS